MKKLLYILMIFSIYMILCGRSCEDDGSRIQQMQEEQAMMARDSIILEFDTESLSEEACRAEEAEAMQHLADLSDYMKIYTDRAMDSTFRGKAAEMIRRMFVSDDVMLSFGPVKKEKMKQVTVKEFLEDGFGDEYIKAAIRFDSIRVIQPIEKSGDELYSGRLAANQIIIEYHETDTIISHSLPITVEFISSRKIRTIGRDTLQLWELKLGDMK